MADLRLIDLYVYRVDAGGVRFLLLHRAPGKLYAGQWRMVGGKVREGETHWQAALREMQEETGLAPREFWALPSVNQFYDHERDCVHTIPAFAARVDDADRITLDSEHTESRWVAAYEAETLLPWPEQVRLIQLLERIVLRNGIIPQWRIDTR